MTYGLRYVLLVDTSSAQTFSVLQAFDFCKVY